MIVTKLGNLLGSGKLFLSIIGANPEEPAKFTKIKLDDGIMAKKVWCSRGKNSYMAVIEVYNSLT